MSDNLEPKPFPELSWGEAELDQSIATLHAWTQEEALRSARWYLKAKGPKARWSRRLRFLTIVLATAGAAIPFVAAICSDVDLEWGYLLFALAAGALGLDRFFGLSTAWMRYLLAEQAIHAALTRFEFRWARELARRGGQVSSREDAAELLDALAGLSEEVLAEVNAETNSWASEFHSNIAALRQLASSAAQPPAPPPEPPADLPERG